MASLLSTAKFVREIKQNLKDIKERGLKANLISIKNFAVAQANTILGVYMTAALAILSSYVPMCEMGVSHGGSIIPECLLLAIATTSQSIATVLGFAAASITTFGKYVEKIGLDPQKFVKRMAYVSVINAFAVLLVAAATMAMFGQYGGDIKAQITIMLGGSAGQLVITYRNLRAQRAKAAESAKPKDAVKGVVVEEP